MPGRGPAPKPASQRRTRHAPQRGEWQATPGIGWQHGPAPDPPAGLLAVTGDVWRAWMGAWFASHWLPEDLPGLTIVANLYDLCASYFLDPFAEKENRKGETVYVLKPNPATELRQMMDNYGITPKGQQDRRWVPPKADDDAKASATPAKGAKYGHLKVVNE